MLAAVELEDGGEELGAEALLLQSLRDGVDRGDLILERRVVDDDPRVAEGVVAAFGLRARLRRNRVQHLLQVVLRPHEFSRGEGLEDDASHSRRPEPQFRVQRHRGGRQREEPLLRRAGQLLLSEENVAEPHQADSPSSRAAMISGQTITARYAAPRMALTISIRTDSP